MFTKFYIALLMMFIVSSAEAQTNTEIESYIEKKLALSNSQTKIDSSISIKKNYHYFLLKKIKSDGKHIGIYVFAKNRIHSSKNYLLFVDNKANKWDVYGENDLPTDLLALEKFFTKKGQISKGTILKCYNYLMENYYEPYGKWGTAPIEN